MRAKGILARKNPFNMYWNWQEYHDTGRYILAMHNIQYMTDSFFVCFFVLIHF